MSGARTEAVMLTVAVILAALALTAGRTTWRREVETLIKADDVVELGCSGQAGSHTCGLNDAGAPIPGVQAPLKPFVTVSGELVALTGLFESPLVQAWLRPGLKPAGQLRVRCAARLLDPAVHLGVRFKQTDALGLREVAAYTVWGCNAVP